MSHVDPLVVFASSVSALGALRVPHSARPRRSERRSVRRNRV